VKLNFKSRAGRRVGAALAAAGILVLATGCTERLPSGMTEIVYHGGLHAKDFKKCIPAGQNGGVSANDATYRYPVNSRDYQFATNTDGAERGSISVLSSDGLTMTVNGAVYFTLNDDCKVLQKFHELVGTAAGAEDGRTDGVGALNDTNWNKMLTKYIGVPVENALDRVTLGYTSTQLVSDKTAKAEWQAAAAKQIKDSIAQVTGGEPYFCKPNYKPNSGDECGEFSIQLNQATPPQQIIDANADKVAATTRASSQQAQAKSQADLIKLYGVQGYLQLQQLQLLRDAMNKGNIPFLPVPAGGSINYTPTK
jgi:hypothetical protein